MTIPQSIDDDRSVAQTSKTDTAPEVLIRAVEPEDAPQMTALLNLPGYRWGTLRLPYQSVSATREKMRPSDGADRATLVAVRDGAIVGTATLTRYEGRRAHAGAVGVGVHDAYVGQGIGTTLLSALLDIADDWWGLRRVELTANADNKAAIRLYERMGFEQEGLLRDYALRGGVLIDTIYMARLRKSEESR